MTERRCYMCAGLEPSIITSTYITQAMHARRSETVHRQSLEMSYAALKPKPYTCRGLSVHSKHKAKKSVHGVEKLCPTRQSGWGQTLPLLH